MACGSFAVAPMKMGNATHTSRGLVPPSEEMVGAVIVEVGDVGLAGLPAW